MSSSVQASSSSTPNFRPIFEKALEEYKKKTGKDPISHPLATEIKGCDSPDDILTVLEGKASELNQSQSSDDRLTKWLNPTVNILNALSATLGEGAGSIFPPTKIIFSGIGILLVAAKDTMANRDVLVELFSGIESFFERLRIYTEAPPPPAVTKLLVKNMADVLQILAIATKGMKEKRRATFLKKLVGMNDDIKDALQRLKKLEQGELFTVIAQTLREASGLQDDAKVIKAMVKEIVNKMDAGNWEEVLPKLKEWLSPPDPSTNYNTGLRSRDPHKETAAWFLEGRIFQEWHSTGSLLWINGKAGSGKSILCSAIIQRILSLYGDGRASVAYFYFDFRDDDKKHCHNLLPSLLVQFAAHSIPCCNMISCVYSTHGKGIQQPSDEVMINCLTEMLSATTQHPIYIVLDALDECPNTSGVRSPREQVLSLLKYLINLRLPNLHICATSRPEPDIYDGLEPLRPRLVPLHDQIGHKKDITNYIRSEVDFIANHKRWREDDKTLVIETLSEKADGMFRWVYCQLEMLRLCLRSRVRHLVNELPDSLDETYERVLKEIYKTNQVYAQRLLQCLAVAIRPLRVVELVKILTTSEPDAIEGDVLTFDADRRSKDEEQELLSACPGLIAVVDSGGSRVVQFSHFSVKEFLTSDRLAASKEDISRYHIFPEAAHATLAQASLAVLIRLDDRVDGRNYLSVPLADYAARYWVSHAQVRSVSSRVMGTMKTLFDPDKPHFAAWVRIYDIDPSSYVLYSRPNPPKPLYYSALCGFYDLVGHLVKKHSQHVNAIGGTLDYPLLAALHGGHIRVAELLVQHGANVDIQGREERAPLHIAIEWPSNLAAGAVQFLLTHRAEINARQNSLSTPLHLAAAQGYFEVAQMLLQRRVDINGGGTPLHLMPKRTSSRSEGNRLIQPLLENDAEVENGAEVNAQNNDHDTPLHLASCNLHLQSVRVLINHGANVNAKNNQGQTPVDLIFLRECDPKDRFDVAQLLVEHGADVNTRNKDRETLLHLASYLLELKLVRILLGHGADVHAEDNHGQTPFHRLFEPEPYDQDRSDVAQLLVEHGADVNTRNSDHETLLHLASYYMEHKLARVLLDHGANVNAEDNRGRTPLHIVLEVEDYSEEVCFDIARLLTERGADVNTPDDNHETPLHLASRLLSLEVVWMLLECGAHINVENKEGKAPFQVVRESIREDMKRLSFKYPNRRAKRRRAQGIALMGLFYAY